MCNGGGGGQDPGPQNLPMDTSITMKFATSNKGGGGGGGIEASFLHFEQLTFPFLEI